MNDEGALDTLGTFWVDARASVFSTEGYRYNTGTESFSGLITGGYQRGSSLFRFTAVGGNTKNQLGYFLVPKPLAEQDPRTNINDTTDNDDFGQYRGHA